jgi:hypothetical protein
MSVSQTLNKSKSMNTSIRSKTNITKGFSPVKWAAVPLLAVGLFVSSVNAQTVVFQDDFSRTPIPPNGGSPLSGTSPVTGATYESGTYGTLFDADTAGSPGSGLAAHAMTVLGGGDLLYLGSGGDLGAATYGTTLFSTALTGQGTVTVNFNFVKFNGDAGDIHVQSFSDAAGTSGLGFDILMKSNGQVAVNSGSGYELVLNGASIGGDIATTFSLTANFVNMTFNASIVNAVTNLTFSGALNTGATGFGSMGMFATVGHIGNDAAVLYMDNLSVTATTAVPEPNTVALMLGSVGIFAFIARRKLRSLVVK